MSTCDYCTEDDSVVTVNGKNACLKHIDNAMRAAFAPVQQALNEARKARQG